MSWRKMIYPRSFVSKLNDYEGEAAETQVWLDYALECEYIEKQVHEAMYDKYEHIVAMLVNMQSNPEKWNLRRK